MWGQRRFSSRNIAGECRLRASQALLARVDFLVVETHDVPQILELLTGTILLAVCDQRGGFLAQETSNALELHGRCGVEIQR
jgi:hypothetical protein